MRKRSLRGSKDTVSLFLVTESNWIRIFVSVSLAFFFFFFVKLHRTALHRGKSKKTDPKQFFQIKNLKVQCCRVHRFPDGALSLSYSSRYLWISKVILPRFQENDVVTSRENNICYSTKQHTRPVSSRKQTQSNLLSQEKEGNNMLNRWLLCFYINPTICKWTFSNFLAPNFGTTQHDHCCFLSCFWRGAFTIMCIFFLWVLWLPVDGGSCYNQQSYFLLFS